MKYFSLIPAFLIFLIISSKVFAANISISLLEQSDYFSIGVDISGLEKTTCKDKTCYLQGMFTLATGSPKYFGYTFGQNDWFPYVGSPEKEYIKSNFIPFETGPEGSWSGVVRLSINKDDPDYKGTGKYLIKIRRYTGESTSAATDDVNQLTVDITETAPLLTPTPTILNTTTTTPTQTSTPTVTTIPSSAPTRNITASTTISSTPKSATTPSQQEDVTNRQSNSEKILGDSTDSTQEAAVEINLFSYASTPASKTSEYIPDTSTSNKRLKYLAISGAIVTLISGGSLYLRLRGAKI